MDKLVIVLVLFCTAVTAFAQISVCLSGVWGPNCSDYNRCLKPGYSCINNRCCRDPVCPNGWSEGKHCSYLPGKPRCPYGYQCIKGSCCQPPQAAGICPRVTLIQPDCRTVLDNMPANVCLSNLDCPKDRLCCSYTCGFKICKKPWSGDPIG